MLIIDIGNTNTKILNTQSQKVYVYPSKELQSKQFSIDIGVSNANKVLVCSVLNNSATNFIMSSFTSEKSQMRLLTTNDILSLIYMDHQVRQFSHIGVDRALKIYNLNSFANGNYMSVGCGTAFTIEVVCNKQFVDSYILPGLFSQYQALNNSTDGLAKINFINRELIESNFADTQVSTKNGIVLSYLGLIQSVVAKWNIKSITVSGGYSKLIASKLENIGLQIFQSNHLELDIMDEFSQNFMS
jgi:pantothenate kinase type III